MIQIPEIIFRHTDWYDSSWSRARDIEAPSRNEFVSKIAGLRGAWQLAGSRISSAISAAAGLAWQETQIVCHITYGVCARTEPLTLNMQSDVHTLTRVLIVRLWSETDNLQRIDRRWRQVMRRFASEDHVTRVHVPLYALHSLVLKRIFSPHIQQRVRARVAHDPRRARAWQIVDEVGDEAVVFQMRPR